MRKAIHFVCLLLAIFGGLSKGRFLSAQPPPPLPLNAQYPASPPPRPPYAPPPSSPSPAPASQGEPNLQVRSNIPKPGEEGYKEQETICNGCCSGCVCYYDTPGCYPSAPATGICCGLTYISMGVAIALVIGVAAVVLSTGESAHAH